MRKRILESLVCAAQQGDGSVLHWGLSDVQSYIDASGAQSGAMRHELASDFDTRAGHTALAPYILRMIRDGQSGSTPEEEAAAREPKGRPWTRLYARLRPATTRRDRMPPEDRTPPGF